METVNNLREKQASEYLQEARNNLKSAEIIYETSKSGGSSLYANAVKEAYDSIESSICAALAFVKAGIPINHGAKVLAFLRAFGTSPKKTEIGSILLKQVGDRESARYVDIVGDKLLVPHELFDERDAAVSISDARKVLEFVSKLSGNKS